jgi:hypothetical protein
MFKRDWIASSDINNYYALNREHNGEDLCNPIKKSTKMHFMITISKSREVHDIFRFDYYIRFIIDFLIQHTFCFVNLIGTL